MVIEKCCPFLIIGDATEGIMKNKEVKENEKVENNTT